MKKLATFLLACLLAFSLFAGSQVSASADDGKVYKLRMAFITTTDHPTVTGFQKAAEELLKRSDGRLVLELYPNGQLGSESESVQNVELGALDMTLIGDGEAANRDPRFFITNMPYVTKDVDHALKIIHSDFMQELYDDYAENGAEMISMLYYGKRHITCTKPIQSVEDMNGIKIRAANQTVSIAIAENVLGGIATPMNLSEVYLALQQGVVQAQENPLPTIYTNKFHEVAPYICLSGHVVTYQGVILSNNTAKTLPEDLLALLREVVVKTCDEISAEIAMQEDMLCETLESEGATIIQPDLSGFENNAAAFVAKWEEEGTIPVGAYNELRALAE